MTEQERLIKANAVIENYCESLKQRLADEVAMYKRNNPEWEFSYLDFKFDEKENIYNLKAVYQKPKTDG